MNILKELRDAWLLFVIVGGCLVGVVALETMRRFVEGAIDRARFRNLRGVPVDSMTGEQFERFLANLFRSMGYKVTLTKRTGDFGADLLLENPAKKEKIAVQAKRHRQPVGVGAVQEVYLAQTIYQCQAAWVVATAGFTPAARSAARAAGVRLMDRTALEETLRRTRTK